jgi:hypothetical protein
VKLRFCVACGAKDVEHHHLVTRAEGGGDDETNLITLCAACHAKLHRRQVNGLYNAHARQRIGIEAAKARGVYKGRPVNVVLRERIAALLATGASWSMVQRDTGCSRATISKVAKQRK